MKRAKVRSDSSDTVVRQNLALNMKLARALYGWSQDVLAERCGLKRPYLGALERGEVNPGIENVGKIARALGVDAHVLLMNAEEAQPEFFRQRGKVTDDRPTTSSVSMDTLRRIGSTLQDFPGSMRVTVKRR